jgi:putative hemolysin
MNDEYFLTGIIVFVITLILDGALFGFAASVHELNLAELSRRAEGGSNKANKIKKWIDKQALLNNCIIIFTMVSNVLVGAFTVNGVARYFGGGFCVYLSVIALLVVITALAGIVIPVRIAFLNPDRSVYVYFTVSRLILMVFSPFVVLVMLIGNIILRIFGVKPDGDDDNVTEEEIMTMVNEGHEQGVIEADEAEMISNIFEFGDKQAADIMTHRSNIVAVDGDLTLEEAVSFMLHENNSRFPVYEGDIDTIIGIIHIKDALKEYGNVAKSEEKIKDIKELLYDVKLIPETRNIDDLFKRMQSEKVHMAVVVDEYGQTVGLVTMEDILEEIVGNILDEHDEDEEQITKKGDDTYIVDGMTLLEDLEEELGIKFEVEDINTINGFIIFKTGRIPDEGQIGTSIEYCGCRFEILEVEGKVIRTVKINRVEE